MLCLTVVLAMAAGARAECLPCEDHDAHAASLASLAPGTAEITYCLGELRVAANGVNAWNLITEGLFRHDVDVYVRDHTDLPTAPWGIFVSANPNYVGEANFGAPLVYEDIFVGDIDGLFVDPPGTVQELEDLFQSGAIRFEYASFGSPAGTSDLVICPEPSAGLLCLIAAVGWAVWRRRRRAVRS